MDPRVKCDQCENEATVHDTTIQKGAVVERHLCESCAREAGLMPPSEPTSQTIVPFGPGQIVITSGPFSGSVLPPGKPPTKGPVKGPAKSPAGEAPEPAPLPPKTPGKGKVVVAVGPTAAKVEPCSRCGMTYSEFKRTGLMGCEACYKAFESQLLPLIERAHEGGSFHLGKTPKRLSTASPERLAMALAEAEARAQRIRTLMRELDVAVASEKYELAAKLRDQLRRMQGGTQASSSGANPQSGASSQASGESHSS
jgi:protein arginine kinase activator